MTEQQYKLNTSTTTKLICFDLDNTLLTQNSWFELNLAMGMTPEEDQAMLAQFKSGSMSYEDWMQRILAIFKDRGLANKENIINALSKYELHPRARDIINYLITNDYKIVLISGSIDLLVEMVSRDLGIDHYKAVNAFIFDDSGNLVDIQTRGNDIHAKLKLLEELSREFGVNVGDFICVGDGANDIEMFKATGKGVTFNDSEIKQHAWRVVGGIEDLRSIL